MRTPVELLDPVPIDAPAPVRLGLVALATDLTFERDAARVLSPEQVALHVTRIPFVNPTTPENLRAMAPDLAGAAALLAPGEPLAAICYGCTAASALIGDAEVEAALGHGQPGVPVVTPARAARRALAALGVHRVALLAPYLAETTGPVIDYLAANGLDVVRACCLGLADDRDISRVPAAAILQAAIAADSPEAEALFLSCTALPALVEVERIEALIGKPVVTANQASLWEMLTIAGLPLPAGFGRLFAASKQVEGGA